MEHGRARPPIYMGARGRRAVATCACGLRSRSRGAAGGNVRQPVRLTHHAGRASGTRRACLHRHPARLAPTRRHRSLALVPTARRAAQCWCVFARMIRALLVLWMALIGANRLDLAGGSLPAVATPFLALTPIVIGALVWGRWGNARALPLGRATLGY